MTELTIMFTCLLLFLLTCTIIFQLSLLAI